MEPGWIDSSGAAGACFTCLCKSPGCFLHCSAAHFSKARLESPKLREWALALARAGQAWCLVPLGYPVLHLLRRKGSRRHMLMQARSWSAEDSIGKPMRPVRATAVDDGMQPHFDSFGVFFVSPRILKARLKIKD